MKRKYNLGATFILAKRELLGFWRNKARIVSSIVQALIFLFVFSAGLFTTRINISGNNIPSNAFISTGIFAMTILFSGVFGGLGLIRDKLFGFMKEVVSSPISRMNVMFGKTLGVAIQCLIQCLVVVALAVGLGYFGGDVSLIYKILLIVPIALLMSVGVTGLGLLLSIRINDFQSFGLIQTFLVMPMFWFSGALFPYNVVPTYMQIGIMINPFSYGVDLIRLVFFGVSFFNVWVDILVIIAFGVVFISIGAYLFRKLEL